MEKKYFSCFLQYSCLFYSWLIISSSKFFCSSSWEARSKLRDKFLSTIYSFFWSFLFHLGKKVIILQDQHTHHHFIQYLGCCYCINIHSIFFLGSIPLYFPVPLWSVLTKLASSVSKSSFQLSLDFYLLLLVFFEALNVASFLGTSSCPIHIS